MTHRRGHSHGRTKLEGSTGTSERSPLAHVLAAEEHAARRPDEPTIDAAVAVREVMLDAIASITHGKDALSAEDREKLADELVKAVRAKPTRWAFAHLALEES